MQIKFVLTESIYDCKIKITDSRGSRYYYISALCEEGAEPPFAVAEVFDGDFSLSLIPMMANTKAMMNEFDTNNWKEKLAQKAAGLILKSLEKIILHVGCSYHMVDVQDGDCLEIRFQTYAFGSFDRWELLALVPMCYAFFEVFGRKERYKLTDAFETNRKAVLKFTRTVLLMDSVFMGFFLLPITYFFQMSRTKRLTKNKKILKTLTKFNNLSAAERERFLEKQEEFFNK